MGAAGAYRLMMVAIALGALALMGATPLLAFLSAALLGLATGPMNPVGSHVLAHFTARLGGFTFLGHAPRRAEVRSQVFCFRRLF